MNRPQKAFLLKDLRTSTTSIIKINAKLFQVWEIEGEKGGQNYVDRGGIGRV